MTHLSDVQSAYHRAVHSRSHHNIDGAFRDNLVNLFGYDAARTSEATKTFRADIIVAAFDDGTVIGQDDVGTGPYFFDVRAKPGWYRPRQAPQPYRDIEARLNSGNRLTAQQESTLRRLLKEHITEYPQESTAWEYCSRCHCWQLRSRYDWEPYTDDKPQPQCFDPRCGCHTDGGFTSVHEEVE